MTTTTNHPDADLFRARFAARVTAGLSETSLELPHDIAERLRVSREQAVARAREARLLRGAVADQTVGVSRGALVLGGTAPWWQRLGYVLPLLLLLAGFLLIDRYASREQVLAAADIDSVLLADDLPPQAYSDPGFAEFLKSPPP